MTQNDRPIGLCFASALIMLTGCAELTNVRGGDPGQIQADVQLLEDDRFAVSVSGVNFDGYKVARCVAAAYAGTQRDEDDNLLFPVYKRDGGKIVDEFRVKDGIRTQTVSGLQTYQLASEGDHDGRDVMAVDLQLAECEKAGLPTSVQ